MGPVSCRLIPFTLIVMFLKEIGRMPSLIPIQSALLIFVIVSAKRLPNNLIPIEYKLKILTNLGNIGQRFNFNGTVLIHIKCLSSTDRIFLHSKNLYVDKESATLNSLNQTDDTPTILEMAHDPENDFLILQLSRTLQADHQYEVRLQFGAELREEKVGYYRSYYVNEYNRKKWLGVTYFKPNNARRAFPCFDELIFKAKFSISLGMLVSYHAIGNMPLYKYEDMNDKPGWKWVYFETTPPMSTYNVAFAVVNYLFEEIESDRLSVNSTIWFRNEFADETDYVIRFSRNFLYIFQTELGMAYPLPKLDIVPIPGFAVPVMESWGLIIWEEAYLVNITNVLFEFNPEIFGVVAKQVVHQWLGNLVTIKSWTDSWFVEGFCRYLSEVAVDRFLFTDLKWLSFEITANILSVLDFDSLHNARAVSEDRFATFGEVMSARAYKKTFLLFHMISHIIGEKNFREITHQYLQTYEYQNAGSKELLQLANKRSAFRNIDVKIVMESWITQGGFPLITVTRNYERGTLEVKQERFFKNDQLLGKDSTRWWIPLTYTTECEMDFDNPAVRNWLSPIDDSVLIERPLSTADWVIFNIDASGLYMVNYDEENWYRIIDFLNKPYFDKIPPLNRALLINNAANLAWVGRLDYRIFLDMIKYLVQERNTHPIYAAILSLDNLNALLKRTPIHKKFVRYATLVHDSIAEIYKNSGVHLKDENPRDDAQVISAACKHEAQDCVEGPLYRSHQRTGFGHIFASVVFLEETILCTGEALKQHSWSTYLESKEEQPDLRYAILRSLVCCENETYLQLYLEETMKMKPGENEDLAPIITAIAGSEVGFTLATEFLSENIEVISHRVFPNELIQIVIEMARYIKTEDELIWLKHFIDANREHFRDFQDGVDEALEIANLNAGWHHKRYRTIETYLADY